MIYFFKKINSAILLLFFLASCHLHETLETDLCIKSNRYADCSSGRPFTGTAITTFDSKKISTKTEFKNGIPDGDWTAYGYQGEVVQTGTYRPIRPNDDLLKDYRISRINLCTTSEGESKLYDVFIVVEFAEKCPSINKDDLKQQLTTFLKKELLIGQKDTLNTIRCALGELENQQ